MDYCICLFTLLAAAYSNGSPDQGIIAECLRRQASIIIPIVVNIEMDISSMELDQIPHNFFAQAEKLERLDASHNRLNVVRKSQFSNATNLLDVDLSFNQISKIERDAFNNGSGRIRSLDFSNNAIQQIPYETFNGLTNLEYLNLSQNQLTEVEARRHPSTNSLKIVDVSFNQLRMVDISAADDGCFNIETLDVSHNVIDHVAPFTKLTKLKHLNLSYNRLEAFKIETFLQLTNLVVLNLAFNKFKTIDVSLLPHSNRIEVIYVGDNPYHQIIGYEYCLTPNLQIVPYNATAHFRFDQAAKAICSFSPKNSATYTASVSSMDIEELNADFFLGANGLVEFNASHNLLKELRKHQFAFAGNLQAVDVSFNEISNIAKEAFDERSKLLKRLDLSQNRIRNIRSETFNHLGRLEYLNLACNELRVIKLGLFAHQSALISLDLSCNNIKMVDLRMILPAAAGIKTFNVIGNEQIEVQGANQTVYPRLLVVRNAPVPALMDIHGRYESVLENKSLILSISVILIMVILAIVISAVAIVNGYKRVRNLKHRLNSITISLQHIQDVDNEEDNKTDHVYDVIRFTP